MSKIALAIICKGIGEETKRLKQALESVVPFVDSVFVTFTSLEKEIPEAVAVARSFNASISYSCPQWKADEKAVAWLGEYFGYEPHIKLNDKLFLFDEARNFNFSQVSKTYDWIFWMDTDDVLVGGEKLREVVQTAEKNGVEAVYFNYIYQADFDPEGNIKHVVIEHLRERLVKNNGKYKWIAPIHETLIEQVPTNKTDNYDCYILHKNTHADRLASLTRNMKNLELAIYKTEGKDPRHNYYLAKAYFDIGTDEALDKAIPLILNHYLLGDHKSGWPEERAQAFEYLAEIYRRKKQFHKALKSAVYALLEAQPSVSVFLNLATTYMLMGEWERALFWVKQSTHVIDKKSTLVKNARDMKARTLEIIFQCCYHLAQIDEAWAAALKLKELFPDEEYVNNNFLLIDQLRQQRDITKTIYALADYLKATGERQKIKPLLQAVPKIAENTPFIADLYLKNQPPTAWGKEEIAIYCGPGFTSWSPKRLEQPGEAFVGGSEEAVIRMSHELQVLGWKVTVYADPGEDEGEYEGVKWLPYWKFNKLDNFNILVIWRQVSFVDQNLKAQKIYIWNHDIQNPLEWNKERIDKITKAIFLSQWHRENVPELPQEKVFLSSNGI